MDTIILENVKKSFNGLQALNGVSFTVKAGAVFGLLGPNGAGKTTLVRILTTLLKPDSGSATVAGFDVVQDQVRLRHVIGLAGQNAAIDGNLTGRENIELVGQLYHIGRAEASRRAEKLLQEFGLDDASGRLAKTYSGGMRRRLDLAASLVGEPKVLFLDEPTTGLDPRSRFALWDAITLLAKNGTTVLLTTQYMEEADKLADKIAVIDRGKIIASGTASELKHMVGGDVLEIHAQEETDLRAVAEQIRELGSHEPHLDRENRSVKMSVASTHKIVVSAVRKLDLAGLDILTVNLRRPTMDDVFLALTGHAAENDTVSP